MTITQLRQISRQLYAEPAKPFAQARPLVRPSDHFKRYSQITHLPRSGAEQNK
jgi:hypothetical protein